MKEQYLAGDISMRKNQKLERMLTQFSYDHKRTDSHVAKIRHSAEELGKMLDKLSTGKDGRKEK